MSNKSHHEITQRAHSLVESRTFGGLGKRGLALAQSTADPDAAVLANDDRAFIGFLTRDVTAVGPTLADSIFPGRIEMPFKSGGSVGIESGALEIEAEGYDVVVTAGDRALAAGTSPGTLLSFADGRLALATEGKTAPFQLSAQLPPEDSANLFRIRARYIGGATA